MKLEKARRLLPPEAGDPGWGPFLYVLTEHLSAKDKLALIKQTEMRKSHVDAWQKLPGRARKLESALKSTRLKKPSQIFGVVAKAPPDEILFLLIIPVRLIQDRIRNYLQKYIPPRRDHRCGSGGQGSNTGDAEVPKTEGRNGGCQVGWPHEEATASAGRADPRPDGHAARTKREIGYSRLKTAGEVREWLNRAVSKTVEPLRVP